MNTSKILFSTLVAAAAMTANATSLSDAVLAIDSFTADNITTLTSAGWTFSNITGTDDGTYTTTGTQSTISNSSVSLTSAATGSRNVWSAIFTVNASVFENSLSCMLVGNTKTDSGVSIAVNGDAVAGGYKNAYWNSSNNNSISYSSLYADESGNVTIGVSFDGNNGTTLYMGGQSVNLNGLKDGATLDTIGLSTASGVVFSNLYWFNTAMSASDMQTAITAVSGMDYDFTFTWAGTESANTWNTTDENWTIKGSATAYAGGGDAVFDSTGYKTVSITGAISATDVTISDNYTFDIAAGGSLSASNISIDENCTATLNLTEGMTLSAAITGSGMLKKEGAGTLTLSGNKVETNLNVSSGELKLLHDNTASSLTGDISIGEGAVFSDEANYKYSLTISGSLSGAGTLYSRMCTGGTSQGDGYRNVTLSGATKDFSGTWRLENGEGNGEANRKIFAVLNSSDSVFGGVIEFYDNGNVDSSKASSFLSLGKDMTIGGLKGTNGTVGSATHSGNTLTDGDRRALTIDLVEGANYNFGGNIASTISALTVTGEGTQILSGDNSTFAGTITVSGGVLVVENVNALGSGTLSVSDGATVVIGVEAVNASAVVLAEGAKFAIDLTDWGVTEGEALQLVLSTSINLGDNADPLSVVEDYFDADKSTLLDFEEYEREWGYDTTAGALTLTFVAIPEPSIFGLLAGMGALALVGTRRRRRA